MAQEMTESVPVTGNPSDAQASAPAKQSVRSFKYGALESCCTRTQLIAFQEEIREIESQI